MSQIEIHVELAEPAFSAPLDYHYFQSVLINLLSNAAESITTDHGEIVLQAARRDVDQMVEFSVSDNGSGIAQDQLLTLFTPFKSTKAKGLGIGLYQCKTIVEAHKGKIYVESGEGRGTTFRIELPLGQ